MSFTTALQDIKKQGISFKTDFGAWLEGINHAFETNYSTDLNIDTVLNDVHNTWADVPQSDLYIVLDSLSNPNTGDKAFKEVDIVSAINKKHKEAKFQVTVPAKLPHDTKTTGERWQNTDVIVGPDRTVTVNYVSGTWTANPANGMVDANGNSSYKAKPGYTLPGENEGALVGRVLNPADGLSKPFLVGNSFTVPNDLSGYLELGINDDLDGRFGEGFDDNEGEIVVEIGINYQA